MIFLCLNTNYFLTGAELLAFENNSRDLLKDINWRNIQGYAIASFTSFKHMHMYTCNFALTTQKYIPIYISFSRKPFWIYSAAGA